MKNKSISILSLLLLTTLAACNVKGNGTESNPLTDNTANTSNTAETAKTESSKASSSTTEDTSGYRKLVSNFDQQDFSALLDYPYTPSTGEINVLVIPVVVSDYKDNATAKVKSDLEKAMFGKSEDTGWESLSSYYEKSSHGALKINGTVSDWYDPNVSSSQMVENNEESGDYTTELMKQAVSWYKKTYNDDCTKYDNNHDGYIDGVFLIYSAYDYYTGETYGEDLDGNLFWAYTTMDYYSTSNLSSPNGGYYFWASFDFLYEGYGESKVDAHTFIHETGHMLSLDDYYSYTTKDKNGTSYYCPMGGVDMMDQNICDQDCFSKFSLGWNSPYYVDHEGDITISSAEDSLDCILIPTKKGEVKNAYDEYVMLELFSPTLGLNEKDLTTGYGNYTNDDTLTKEGIRAYHVDKRVCKFTEDRYGNISNVSYADLNNIDDDYYYYYAHSNSIEGYYDGEANYSFNYLNPEYLGITQLSKSNRVFDKNDYYFEDQDMYFEGDSFNFASSSAQFPNKTKMNNGSELAYNFTVTEIKDHKATIHFTKN